MLNGFRALVLGLSCMAASGCEGIMGIPLDGMPDAPCKCNPAKPESCRVAYQNPQICPDLSPIPFCSRFIGKSASVDLLLFNRGYTGLKIESVELIGDDNCAFVPPQLSFKTGAEGTIIPYSGSGVVRLTYAPTKKAQDFGLIRVTSNAENFKVLNIAICGEGIMMGGAPTPDGGMCLGCMARRSDKTACGKAEGM